jgi:amidase
MTNVPRLVPLLVRSAATAIDFYRRTFGAAEVVRCDNANNQSVSHSDLEIDRARSTLTEEAREWGCDAPPSLGGSPVGPGTPESSPPPAALSTSALSSVAFESAVELARRIRDKEVSSLELTLCFIDRIERLDDRLGAIAVRDFDRAIDAAREADLAIARGEVVGPLHGLPMTIKEAFDVVGLATTWGVPALADNRASADAEAVARFRAAGAHFLGKTNVPVMLGDFQSDNPLFGATKNPWDLGRTPGGSSGGSAAAVAAGLTCVDIGSDLGGSVRNPAHYCGVYAHKPTFGIVSMRGHAIPPVPARADMAVAGPIARSPEDLALALEILAGPDRLEGSGWRLDLPPPRRSSLAGLRVAVWSSDPSAPVDDEISERLQRAADVIAHRGGIVSDRARPAFDAAAYRRTYAALVGSAQGAILSDAEYEAHRERASRIDPDDSSKPAAFARALVSSHRSWLRWDAERARYRAQWRAFFDEWDILLCPTMATTAFPHDRRPVGERTVMVNGLDQPYFDQVFWACLATLSYLPATVFPFGRSPSGLPIGLQAIGAEHADLTTLALSRWMADEEGGFTPPDFAMD